MVIAAPKNNLFIFFFVYGLAFLTLQKYEKLQIAAFFFGRIRKNAYLCGQIINLRTKGIAR
jgi:hypothetical protein